MKKLILLLLLFPVALFGREITVSTPMELFEAIAPNNTIRITPGDYNFSLLPSGHSSEYARYNDGEVVIRNVKNLTMVGEGYAECGTEDPYSNVFRFEDCQSITIENLILGHFIEKGYCEGSVISFENCQDISINKSVMYGSGTYGIQAFKVDGIEVTNSVIKDCSYGVIYFNDVTNVEFSNTHFKRCQSGLAFRGESRLILFTDCYFTGMKDYQDWSKWNEDSKYVIYLDASVQSVLLKNNRFDRNGTEFFISDHPDVTIKGTTGSGNNFSLDN